MKLTMKHIVKSSAFTLIPLALTFVTLNFYGFVKPFILVLLLFILFFIYLKAGFKNAFMFSVTLFISTIILNFLVALFLEDKMYYRPYEKLSVYNAELGRKLYKKNADMIFNMPFGDIKAVGNLKDIDLEPRKIRFKTDSLGFRNNGNYNGEKYVIVGDSFVAANGTDQVDIITTQLKNKWNKSVYSLGYEGGIPEYVRYVLYLKGKTEKDFKVLIFLFEGNDFPDSISKRQMIINKPQRKIFYERIKAFFEETALYRYTFSLMARFTNKHQKAKLFYLQGHRIGEFEDYVNATERNSYILPENAIKMLYIIKNRIEHIFFIPTKYRVYFPFIENKDKIELPHSQWKATQDLARALGVGCTDLTEMLRKESERLLKEGKFTFWKDDSHWNGYGIAIAAKAVNDYINKVENGH